MANYTSTLFPLYTPDVNSDDTKNDFFPGLADNFQKVSKQFIDLWITPQQLGAAADYNFANRSGTDDAPAIQAALDIARDRGSVNLLIPPGIYRLGAELTIYKNTRIVAAPGARLVKTHNQFIAINGERNQSFAPAIYEGAGNISITGGIWDGNGTYQTKPGGGFYFGHASNIKLDHVTIRDVYQESAIIFSAVLGFTVKDCSLLGCAGDAADIPAIHIANATNDAIVLPADGESCKNGFIENNYINSSDLFGAHSSGVGSRRAVVDKPHTNITVHANSFENTKKSAVYAYNWTRSKIINNDLKSCDAGIRVKAIDPSNTEDTKNAKGEQTGASGNLDNIQVEGNTITDGITVYYAIIFEGFSGGKIRNSSIKGNKVLGDKAVQKWAGIYIKQAECTVIEGNFLVGIGGHGLVITDTSNNNLINGNIIRHTRAMGIYISTASHYNTIANNQLKQIGSDGMRIDSVEGTVISSNSINAVSVETENYAYINITGTCNILSLSGNVVRSYGSSGTTATALSISSSAKNVTRTGNVWAGVGGVKDNSSSTKAGEIE